MDMLFVSQRLIAFRPKAFLSYPTISVALVGNPI
jgi:hypothetical protein